MNTIKFNAVSGLVQYAESEAQLLASYNRSGNLYEIRDGKNGRELWHKEERQMCGQIVPLPANPNEVDVTEFFNSTCARDYSASVAEIGENAGPITWRNAMGASASAWLLLRDDETRDQFKRYIHGFGAWSDDEVAAWSDVELNALFIQFVAGDIREAGLDRGVSWAEYQEDARVGTVSGRLWRDDDGRIFYDISE